MVQGYRYKFLNVFHFLIIFYCLSFVNNNCHRLKVKFIYLNCYCYKLNFFIIIVDY